MAVNWDVLVSLGRNGEEASEEDNCSRSVCIFSTKPKEKAKKQRFDQERCDFQWNLLPEWL